MPTTPDDIVNEALDELGVEEIGDIHEGSRTANVARRNYDPMLRAMHAAAPWNFARRQRQIDIRGDASGQYHTNRNVPLHWAYMYEWPNDCVHARYVLGLNAYALDESGAPLYAQAPWARPAPFLVTDAPLVNDIASDWSLTEGHNPESTRIIATNQLGAMLVYTGLVQYPDAWDPGFRRAFVAALAARLAMAAIEDKGAARAIRGDQLQIAREALIEARVRDGNEGWTVVDHTPDWIRIRSGGGWGREWYGTGWANFPFVEDAGGVY
jgi:hypothetical protein